MIKRVTLICFMAIMLQGCASMVIGTAVDATIAVAKVPFKVGGAVVDAARQNKDKED